MTPHHLFIHAEAWSGRVINQWLQVADVNACMGRGSFTFTSDRSKAMTFPDLQAALAYWKRQSDLVPLRDDGKPNRPLTAFTAQPVPAGKEPAGV